MIKKIFIGMAVLLVVLLLAGFLLPSATHINKSIAITAPAGYVFEEINDLKNWSRWSYWNSIDPEMKMEFSETAVGSGAWYSWDGPKTGTGKLSIIESTPNQALTTEVAFSNSGAGVATYKLEAGKDGVMLSSDFHFEHGADVLSRWMGLLFIGPEVGKAMEYEAAKLKELAEAKPKFAVTITEVEAPAISYIGLSHTMNPQDPVAISKQMSKMYGELMLVLQKAKVEMAGYPFCLYPSFSETSMEMVCALPVGADAKVPAKYKLMQTTGGAAVKAVHFGDYNTLESTHNQLNQYIAWKKLEINGAPWEVYITDPELEKDTTRWITEVYYPVRK